MVLAILARALAVATDKAVRPGTRAIVDAVAALKAEGKTRISLKAASRRAGRSSSTTHTDVHDALDAGYLLNHSQSPDPFDLDIADPLPDDLEILPSAEELAQAFGHRSSTVRLPTERYNPHCRAEKRKAFGAFGRI